MAVTRLLRIKETKGNNPSAHLKKNIFYICNPEKTEGGLYIGGNAGFSPEMIYAAFIQNKQNWGKETNSLKNCTQGFHYMLSFPPESGVSETLAYQITQGFCEQLLGDRYYYVFTVHNDKAHMHTHITFDSVSKEDGYMFHSPKKDWEKRIQPITDRLCEKYHLPTLQYDPSGDRRGKNYGAWDHDKGSDARAAKGDARSTRQGKNAVGQKKYNWYDIIRDDIDEAITKSGSYEEFLSELRRQKYTVRDGKYLSLKPYGKEKAVRTGRLGAGYANTEIRSRIADKSLTAQIQNRYKTYGDREEMREIIYAKTIRTKGFKMTPFQKEFYKRWNNTFFIRKPDRVQSWKYKKNIIEVQNLANAIRYLVDFDIGSLPQLEKRQAQLESEREAVSRKYNALRTKLYRAQPFFALRQYEKILRQYEKSPTDLLATKLESIRSEIEEICPFEEAKSRYKDLQEEIMQCRKVLRDVKQEEKLAAQTKETFYNTEPYEDLQEAEQEKQIPDPQPDREQFVQTRNAERRLK